MNNHHEGRTQQEYRDITAPIPLSTVPTTAMTVKHPPPTDRTVQLNYNAQHNSDPAPSNLQHVDPNLPTRTGRTLPLREHGRIISGIKNRWLRAINIRLTNDRITASKIKRKNTTLQLAVSTWKAVLDREWELPPNWITHREVLVGRGARNIRSGDENVH
ncbi:hypothetical protein EDB87DRAFT_1418897 [Lactarius vividus]|nr:hypothetical protein EDB87DRAFT_1418897 [Lactarius vividus]